MTIWQKIEQMNAEEIKEHGVKESDFFAKGILFFSLMMLFFGVPGVTYFANWEPLVGVVGAIVFGAVFCWGLGIFALFWSIDIQTKVNQLKNHT